MEFEEMKKIWDVQNKKPLYVINEEALYRSILAKKKRAIRMNNSNDFGLTAIFVVTAIIILTRTPNIYDYLIVATLLLIICYIWLGRIKRKKKNQTFGRTMLGDLDYALSSITYEAKRSKSMVWWFVLPLMILTFLNMSQEITSIWKWLGIGFAFVLSALLSRWSYSHRKAERQKLEVLRDKLTEDTEVKPL